MITTSSTIVVSKDQVSCDLAGEAAILNLKNGVYYGLDTVGASIWNRIQQPATVASVREALVQEFDVDAQRCEKDLLELLQKLATEGLVEVTHETAA
jgi:Coenzyme PQQ synthesis protein D (PqqD)